MVVGGETKRQKSSCLFCLLGASLALYLGESSNCISLPVTLVQQKEPLRLSHSHTVIHSTCVSCKCMFTHSHINYPLLRLPHLCFSLI